MSFTSSFEVRVAYYHPNIMIKRVYLIILNIPSFTIVSPDSATPRPPDIIVIMKLAKNATMVSIIDMISGRKLSPA